MKALRWFLLWLFIVLGMCLQGALVGGILFIVGGLLLGMDLSVAELALNGVKDGAFLAFIWAPGTGIVVCFMQAYGQVRKSEANFPKALDRGNKEN